MNINHIIYEVLNKLPINHLEQIDKLGLNPNEYVIVGSAACVLYGMNYDNHDIDITISETEFDKIKSKLILGRHDGIHDNMYKDQSGYLDINLGNIYPELSFKLLKSKSHLVNGYRFLTVDGLKYFYRFLYDKHHMKKHKDHLEWLEHEYK